MNTRRADQLRETLEDEIVGGDITPGTRLDEVKLAQRFGASRTPVREALHKLAAAGLVELRPRRGAFVRRFDIGDLVQMFEVMAEFEGICARMAAKRMSVEELGALREAHDACAELAQAGKALDYYHANARFHALLYQGCHNHYLLQEIDRLQGRLQAYRRLQMRMRGRMEDSFHEHEVIVQAIADRDGDAAARHAREHLRIQGESFNDFIAQLRGLHAGNDRPA